MLTSVWTKSFVRRRTCTVSTFLAHISAPATMATSGRMGSAPVSGHLAWLFIFARCRFFVIFFAEYLRDAQPHFNLRQQRQATSKSCQWYQHKAGIPPGKRCSFAQHTLARALPLCVTLNGTTSTLSATFIRLLLQV